MWRMLLKYLEQTPGAASEQVLAVRTGAWVQTQGEHAGTHLQRLMKALQTYIGMPWDDDKCYAQWVKQIGGSQLLLPVSVLNEYCHPTRPFEPCPDFSQEIDLPHSRKITIDKDYDDLLAVSWTGGSLGCGFASARYSFAPAWGQGCGWGGRNAEVRGMGSLGADLRAIETLCSTRTQQRDRLMTELSKGSTVGASHRMAAGM